MRNNLWRFRAEGRLLAAAAFLGALAVAGPCAAQAGATNGVGTQFELTFWESVAGSDDPSLYEAYLEKYPDGTFAALARAKSAALRKAARTAPAPAPVPAVAAPAVPPVAPVVPVARVIQTTAVVPPVPAAPPIAAPAPPQPPAPALAPALAMASPPPPQAAPQVVQASTEASGSASTLGRLLAELQRSQESSSGSTADYAAPAAGAPTPPAANLPLALGFTMPQRPQLAAVPTVTMPPSFCSAEERNAFHDGTYQPAVEVAKRNNDAAVAYMTRIRTVYNSYQADSDPNTMNALAAEARDYQPLARAAFDAQGALVSQFDVLMAVPIKPCAAPK